MLNFLHFTLVIALMFQSDAITKIKIDPEKDKEKKLLLSEIASDVSYIKLETKPECLISEISQVLIDDDLVFILHRGQAPTESGIMVFNKNGGFVNQFGRFGRGPGEFASLIDFSLDKENNLLYMLDSMGKLLVFDYKGNFIRSIKLDFKPTCFELSHNCLFMVQAWPLYFMNDGYAVTIRDLSNTKSDMKLLKRSSVKFDKIIQNTLVYPNLWLNENGQGSVSLLEAKFDTLYHFLTNGRYIPKYIIELDKKQPRDLFLTNEYQASYKTYNIYDSILETEKYLIFTVSCYNNTAYLYIFNKSTNQLQKHNTNLYRDYIFNDYDGGISFRPKGLAEKDLLFSVVKISTLKDKLGKTQEIKNIEANKKLTATAQSSDIYDNPMIMLVKLK